MFWYVAFGVLTTVTKLDSMDCKVTMGFKEDESNIFTYLTNIDLYRTKRVDTIETPFGYNPLKIVFEISGKLRDVVLKVTVDDKKSVKYLIDDSDARQLHRSFMIEWISDDLQPYYMRCDNKGQIALNMDLHPTTMLSYMVKDLATEYEKVTIHAGQRLKSDLNFFVQKIGERYTLRYTLQGATYHSDLVHVWNHLFLKEFIVKGDVVLKNWTGKDRLLQEQSINVKCTYKSIRMSFGKEIEDHENEKIITFITARSFYYTIVLVVNTNSIAYGPSQSVEFINMNGLEGTLFGKRQFYLERNQPKVTKSLIVLRDPGKFIETDSIDITCYDTKQNK